MWQLLCFRERELSAIFGSVVTPEYSATKPKQSLDLVLIGLLGNLGKFIEKNRLHL